MDRRKTNCQKQSLYILRVNGDSQHPSDRASNNSEVSNRLERIASESQCIVQMHPLITDSARTTQLLGERPLKTYHSSPTRKRGVAHSLACASGYCGTFLTAARLSASYTLIVGVAGLVRAWIFRDFLKSHTFSYPKIQC